MRESGTVDKSVDGETDAINISRCKKQKQNIIKRREKQEQYMNQKMEKTQHYINQEESGAEAKSEDR